MTKDRWKDILAKIEEQFTVVDRGSDHDDEQGGVDFEYIIFDGPIGQIKLQLETRKIVIDKKTTYSNRIGSDVAIEYIYSPTETSSKLFVWRWDENEDDWLPMDSSNFAL